MILVTPFVESSTVERSTVESSTVERSTVERSTVERSIVESSTVENSSVDHPGIPLEDEWKSTDEEEMDTLDDASTDKHSNVVPSWSPVLTTDTEVDLFEESDSEDLTVVAGAMY